MTRGSIANGRVPPLPKPLVFRHSLSLRGHRKAAVRTAQAAMRKWQENLLLAQEVRFMKWGWQSELARRLGVHRSTICRDCSEFLEAKRLGISMEQVVELRRLRKSTDKRMWRGMRW